jgi:hypothetical protein
MQRVRTPRRQGQLGWSKEDEDVMACQVISAFSWIFFVLLVNFFLLHRSNTIPEAEANWVEPQTALRPPAIAQPLPQMAMLPDHEPWEVKREFLEDDYKPNYYFLYKDQIRFVDRPIKKKTVVASLKTIVPPMVEPEKEEIVEKEWKKPIEKPKPIQLEWLDMALVEETETEKPEPVKEPPKAPTPQAVRMAMVQDLDMDMQIAQDTPTPVIPQEPKQIAKRAMPKMRASALDLDMEIIEQPPPEKPARVVAPAPRRKQQAIRTAAGADYVSLPMEIASEEASYPTTAKVANQPAQKGTPHRALIAKGRTGPAANVPMSLEIGEKRENGSRSGTQGTIKKEAKPARFAAVKGRAAGGIDLPFGILEGQERGTGTGKGVHPPPSPKSLGRVTLQTSKGSIQLGAPLAFALADVGSETHSGSAYTRNSTHVKRLLEQQALPDKPVTVSTADSIDPRKGSNSLIGVSYSRTQVVLQYANGKQHVISLVPGEPYPRFEMRRSADGAKSVPVGTKLEEITFCLSTLQQFLKE